MAISDQQFDDIEQAQASRHETRRATVPAMEDIIYEPLDVLDQGFVRLIDYMGDDAAIVQSARVSYGRGTKQVSNDRGLINYLMRHRHTSPFEMCEIKLHIKLPIFIARQWIRHRTANVNEYSGRYSEMSKGFYLPDQVHQQSMTNKQGSGEPFSQERQDEILKSWAISCGASHASYADDLDEGVSREEARITLPLNTYTEWYWKIDLHNLMHFLCLRADGHAQAEIRAYADVMLGIVKRWVPVTYEAFLNHRLESVTISRSIAQALHRCIFGDGPLEKPGDVSEREWFDAMRSLGIGCQS